MAIKGGEIKYSVSFDVNMQRLNQAFDKIRQLTAHDLMKINPDINTDLATKLINELWKQTSALETAFEKAFNPKLNTVNILTLNKSLKDSGTSLQTVYNEYKKAGSTGESAFRAMSSKLLDTNIKLKETSGLFKEIGTTLKNSIKWNIASSVINTFSGKVQEAYGYVKNLDSSLNDIRIVTGKSAEEMDKFAEKANKAAQTLGKSTTDYTKASLIYYQLGLSDEETAARTDVTLKAANVTQLSTQEVSEQLTAVWNGYKVSAQEAELYVDKLAAVAAGTASDLEELSTGMSKVASAANALGVDVDLMNAILSTSISVTRLAPETIGSAYKTIFARMSTIAAGGTDEEDGATLTSYTEKMSKLGVNVLDANNQLRDMGDVVEEVGGKWNTFSKELQIALAQVMAGTRQYNNLIALFDNWDKYTEALNMSANAAGTLNKLQEIYMESTQAKLQSLSTAVEGVFDSLLSSKDIGKVADTLTPIVGEIESIIDAVGGGTGILAMFGPALLRSFGPDVSKLILTFKHNIEAITLNKALLDNYIQTLQTLTSIKVTGGADLELLKYLNILASMALYMKPEEYQEMINQVNALSLTYNKQGLILLDLLIIYDRLSQTLNKPIDANNYEESVNLFLRALGLIGATIQNINEKKIDVLFNDESLKTLGSSFHQVDGKIRQFKKEISKLTDDEQKMATVFVNMRSGIKSLGTSVKGLEDIMGTKARGPFTNFRNELKRILAELTAGNWSQKLVTDYQAVMDGLAKEIEKLQAVADDSPEAAEKLQELKKAFNEAAAQTGKLLVSIEDSQVKAATEGIVSLSTSLLLLSATLITFSDSWNNIWNDENLTSADKFKKSLQLIAFSGVSLLNMFSGVGKSIKNLTGVFKTATASSLANAGANAVLAKSQEKVAKAAKEAKKEVNEAAEIDKKEKVTSEANAVGNATLAAAQEAVKKAAETGTAGKVVGAGAKAVGQAATGVAGGATTAAVTGAGAAGAGAAAGAGSFIASLGAMLAAAAPVIVAVGALATVFGVVAYSMYKADLEAKKYETQLKNAEKAHKETQENLSKVRIEYDNLTTAIENLRSEQDALDTMTKGTSEWKDQLQKVNEEVTTLLENFPELKKYATYENGQWVIKDEKLEEYQKLLEDRVKFLTTANLATENKKVESESLNSLTSTEEFQKIVENMAAGTGYDKNKVRDMLLEDLKLDENTVRNFLRTAYLYTTAAKEKGWGSEEAQGAKRSSYQYSKDFKLFGPDSKMTVNGQYFNLAKEYTQFLLDFPEELKEKYFQESLNIVSENTKAMVGTQYGSLTNEILTDNNITDEKYRNIVTNATNAATASMVESNYLGVENLYFNEKGQLKSELNGNELKAVEDFLLLYYAINKSTDEKMLTADDVTVDLEDNKVKVNGEEITIDWNENGLKDIFVGQLALANEEKSAKNFAEYYSNNMADATIAAVANGTDVATLTSEELSAALDRVGKYLYNAPYEDKFLEAVDTLNKDVQNAQNKILSNEVRWLYANMAKDATGELKIALAEKISDIEQQFGIKTALSFIELMKDVPTDEILKFDINQLSSDLSVATKKALEDAKIDEAVFKNYKENYKNMGLEYDDETIIRYILAEDDLNKIYDDRKDIFKSLSNAQEDFKSGNLDLTQLGYINQMQTALSKLTGFDVTAELVVNNLDAILSYLTGTEQGAKDLLQALTNIKMDELDKIFKSSNVEVGMAAAQVVVDKVNLLAEDLLLSEQEVTLLYAQYGYIYNSTTQQYEKNTNAINIIKSEIQYNEGTVKSEAELLEEYGLDNAEDLKEFGWTPHYTPAGTYWEKTTLFFNGIDMSSYVIHDGQIYQILEDIKGKTAEALEAEGCTNLGTDDDPQWVIPVTLDTIIGTKVSTDKVGLYTPPGPGKDGNKNKLSGSEKNYNKKYEVVYDFYDLTIAAKERELKALQDAEKNLTGEALTSNLNKQKELYEEIVKQQEEKLKLAKEDIDLQKKKVDNLASEYNLNVQYDDNGYISNIGDILKLFDDNVANAGKEYDEKYKELKEKQDNDESLEDAETEKLQELSDAYDKATDKLNDFKEAYDEYISALDKKNDVIDNIIETQNNIDDTRISSYLAATNKEFERLSTEASNFASAMSDAVAQFLKLSDDELIDSLKKWQDIASILKEVYSLQKETLKNDLGNIVSMGDASDSGLANNDEWKLIAEDIKSIQSSDKDLLDMTKYLEILARIENLITLAQKNLDDLRARGASEDDIKNATARLNSYKAIKTEMEEGAKAALALAKNMDDIYLTAGEVKDLFVDWQVSAIDTQIGLIDKKISRLQKQAGKLKGQALIDNLKQQNQLIEKLIKLEKGKLKILQAQMKIKKLLLLQSLSELAASLGTQLSLSFDNLGNITAESIELMQRVVTASLQGAGAMGAAAQQQWNALLLSMESYNAAAAAVQASMDAIEGYGDSMQDNVDSMKEALKEARNLALEIFNAKVDVEINIEDAWRQFDKLKATMNGIKENNFLAQAELSARNIQRYLGDISNPNSYFGSGKGSIGILTDHLNDIMSEISVMQSGGESQYYGKDEGAAFDDLTNYANQLMSLVEAYYQELENVRQQYSNVIDAIISKNQELIDDYDKMNQLNKHGINISKLLYGEESYDKLSQYYNNISNNTKEMLKTVADSKQYYAELMARLEALGDTDSEAYQKMREGYEESMLQVYEYGEQLLEQYSEELMNKVNSYQLKMTDTLANLAGFADKLLMDLDWEYQTKLMDDYLDATNAAYEMQALQSKFQSSIDDTDSLSAKKELTKVMNEQLGILEKLLEDGQILTLYDIDRANKVYELTLKLIALEEAQLNKSKMRLRRDSQGNYRYEYVADQLKVEDARLELLKAQNDLYNLDKKRTVEMINEIQTLQADYYAKQKAILEDSYLSEEEKKLALADLEMKYYGQPDGIIYMAVQEYAEAKKNMESMTDLEITFYHNTMAEAMALNWNNIAAAENENTQQILQDLDDLAAKVEEATELMKQGYESLDDAIKNDISSMENLLHLDEQLLSQYEKEMLAIEDLMKELEDLEDHYKSVLDAAMAAVEAALQLRQMSWEEDDNKSSNSSNNNTSNNGSGSTTESSGGGGSISSRYAEIKVNNNNKGCISSNNGNLTKSEKSTIQSRAKNRGLNISTAMLSDKEAEKKYGKVTTLYIPFDTGGYTGQWGNEGKIAMLHEKELVLNKTDTQNILDAVSIVRNLTSGLSSLLNSLIGLLTSSTQNISNNIDKEKTILDLNVHIEATFPNVSNSNEIEKAFNDLVNLASLRAMSTRR